MLALRLLINDGRTYRVIKIFHDLVQLQASLQSLGCLDQVHSNEHYFLYGLFDR